MAAGDRVRRPRTAPGLPMKLFLLPDGTAMPFLRRRVGAVVGTPGAVRILDLPYTWEVAVARVFEPRSGCRKPLSDVAELTMQLAAEKYLKAMLRRQRFLQLRRTRSGRHCDRNPALPRLCRPARPYCSYAGESADIVKQCVASERSQLPSPTLRLSGQASRAQCSDYKRALVRLSTAIIRRMQWPDARILPRVLARCRRRVSRVPASTEPHRIRRSFSGGHSPS